MNKTKIEWVKNPDGTQGYTLNSKTGCLNHTKGLCKGGGFPCFAYKLANGRLKSLYLANPNTVPQYAGMRLISLGDHIDPFYPRWWHSRLDQIRRRKKPAGIFLDDMSDWMGSYWSELLTEQELQMMRDCPQHRIYTLTKQPQNLIKFSPFPPNCYVGVTITNNKMRYDAFYWLKQIQASVKYLSIEPFLGRIEIAPIDLQDAGINQVILGAQTKPYKPPEISWVREIVGACDKAGVKVFLKNNLGHSLQYQHAKDLALTHRPDQHGVLVLRQEFPDV